MSEREKFVTALVELMQEGSLTLAEAVRMYRSEFHDPVGYMLDMGILGRLKRAEKK